MGDPVIIIGAGLAGLSCANALNGHGIEVLLLESSDGMGGRVRTDEANGFLLDRGFQVLLTAYPESRRQLDYSKLHMCNFEPGSLVKTSSGMQRICDPWRRPSRLFETAFSDIGSFADKMRIGRLRWVSGRRTIEDIFTRPELTTARELKRLGFSESMMEKFLRPFLGGVFLESELETSSRMLHFVFRMFSQGDTAIPARGMGQITGQLASQLPEESIRLNAPVASIDQQRVRLESGEQIPGRRVVVAVENGSAAKLVPSLVPSKPARSVTCVYFAANEPPFTDRMLLLNGTGSGLVNNMCVASQIAPNYSSDGRSLISATVLKFFSDPETLQIGIKDQVKLWFGNMVDDWEHIRTYQIKNALPDQSPGSLSRPNQSNQLAGGVFVCGDYCTNGSIHGALQSGRLTAEQLIDQL